MFDGKRTYKCSGKDFYLWWLEVASSWEISAAVGDVGTLSWKRTDPDIEGLYTPQGTAIGDATIAEIV